MSLRQAILATWLITCVGAPGATAQTFSRFLPLCDGFPTTGGIVLGDVDGDTDLDLVIANGQHLPEPDWVMSNDGRGNFYAKRVLGAGTLNGGAPDASYGVALADIDGDRDLDAVLANDITSGSVVHQNDGRGNFTVLSYIGSVGQARRAVGVGDFDKDGDTDVVLVGLTQDHVYFNDGNGRRWTERPLGSRALGRATGVAVADVDADTDLDIVVPGRYEADTLVFINDGRGGFGESRNIGGAEDTTAVAVGDIDGDGDPDIVAANWGQLHTVYANDGRGQFKKAGTFGAGEELVWSVALGDLDLDGDLDAVVGTVNVGFWSDDTNGDGVNDRFGREAFGVPGRVYVNDGRGRFLPGPPVTTGSENTRPIALGDVDGDGDLDIVTGSTCQPNYVFFNSVRGPKVPVVDPALSSARRRWSGVASSADKAAYELFLSDDAVWIDFTGKIGDKTALLAVTPLHATSGETDIRHYPSGKVIVGYRAGGALRHLQVWVPNGDAWRMVLTQEVRGSVDNPINFWPPWSVSSSLPPALGPPKSQQEVGAVIQSLDAAMQAQDRDRLTVLTTSEFVAQSAAGQVRDRDEWLKSSADGHGSGNQVDRQVEQNTTRIHGDLAVSNRILRAVNGGRFVQTIVSVKQDGRWAVAALATTAISD